MTRDIHIRDRHIRDRHRRDIQSPMGTLLSLRRWATLAVLCLTAATASAGELQLDGFVAAQGVASRSPASWLSGGFGRLASGEGTALEPDDDATDALGQLHLALRWQMSPRFSAFVHGVARAESSDDLGDAAGLVEAYLQGDWVLRQRHLLRFRLGHFFLPSSKENVELGWSSPYTLTFSALNSWIGEETRLTGLLGEYTHTLAGEDRLTAGLSVFGGNDTNGTLLAWRGWTVGDRLSGFGEVLPLPPLEIFEPGSAFELQRTDGTKPFSDDLDGRAGWAGFLRWQRGPFAAAQLTHYDNRGDHNLYDGQYAWDTQMNILGFEAHPGTWSLVGEHMDGSSAMGFFGLSKVDIDFEASYGLVSWQPGPLRLTVRYDRFEVVDRDPITIDNNNEDGEGWTVAAFWEPTRSLRLGLEVLELDVHRPALAAYSFEPQSEGQSLKLELRWYFGL